MPSSANGFELSPPRWFLDVPKIHLYVEVKAGEKYQSDTHHREVVKADGIGSV